MWFCSRMKRETRMVPFLLGFRRIFRGVLHFVADSEFYSDTNTDRVRTSKPSHTARLTQKAGTKKPTPFKATAWSVIVHTRDAPAKFGHAHSHGFGMTESPRPFTTDLMLVEPNFRVALCHVLFGFSKAGSFGHLGGSFFSGFLFFWGVFPTSTSHPFVRACVFFWGIFCVFRLPFLFSGGSCLPS